MEEDGNELKRLQHIHQSLTQAVNLQGQLNAIRALDAERIVNGAISLGGVGIYFTAQEDILELVYFAERLAAKRINIAMKKLASEILPEWLEDE